MKPTFHVYILTNANRALYIGVTNNLARRVAEHKSRTVPGFTAKYGIDTLIHIEASDSINAAIAREKDLKGWRRARKIALIEESNPEWEELSVG
jgi:putative endonuclease